MNEPDASKVTPTIKVDTGNPRDWPQDVMGDAPLLDRYCMKCGEHFRGIEARRVCLECDVAGFGQEETMPEHQRPVVAPPEPIYSEPAKPITATGPLPEQPTPPDDLPLPASHPRAQKQEIERNRIRRDLQRGGELADEMLEGTKPDPEMENALLNWETISKQLQAALTKSWDEGHAAGYLKGQKEHRVFPEQPEDFNTALKHLIHHYSRETASDTPDFILANYLEDCLLIWDQTIQRRNKWYNDKLPKKD
jgi:hypothetical protein